MADKGRLEEALASYDDSAIIRTFIILTFVPFTYFDSTFVFAAHVPFDPLGQGAYPVRAALATLWSICKNGAYAYYEGAVALLEYVRDQFPNVSTTNYDRFMVDLRLKVRLRMVVKDYELTLPVLFFSSDGNVCLFILVTH